MSNGDQVELLLRAYVKLSQSYKASKAAYDQIQSRNWQLQADVHLLTHRNEQLYAQVCQLSANTLPQPGQEAAQPPPARAEPKRAVEREKLDQPDRAEPSSKKPKGASSSTS